MILFHEGYQLLIETVEKPFIIFKLHKSNLIQI